MTSSSIILIVIFAMTTAYVGRMVFVSPRRGSFEGHLEKRSGKAFHRIKTLVDAHPIAKTSILALIGFGLVLQRGLLVSAVPFLCLILVVGAPAIIVRRNRRAMFRAGTTSPQPSEWLQSIQQTPKTIITNYGFFLGGCFAGCINVVLYLHHVFGK